MKSLDNLLLRKQLLHIPADYRWTDAGIVRIGAARDIAAYAIGDFRGKSLIFCHGNGETAVSERYWFEQLAAGAEVCSAACRLHSREMMGKTGMDCLIFGHKKRISGKEGLWHGFC